MAERDAPFFLGLKAALSSGVFRPIVDLQAAIDRFFVDHKAEPNPLVWTADADKFSRRSPAGLR